MVSPIRATGFKIHRRKAIPQSFILNFSLLIKKGGFPPFHFLINTRYLGLPPLAPAKPFAKGLTENSFARFARRFLRKQTFKGRFSALYFSLSTPIISSSRSTKQTPSFMRMITGFSPFFMSVSFAERAGYSYFLPL